MIDTEKIEKAVRMILEAIGEDPDREGLRETPVRVARMYKEIFCGLWEDPEIHLEKIFSEDHEEMILVKDIPIYSMCEHHLLPFFGKAHVAYIPRRGRVTGLSKLARVVEGYAKRPQLQERLTTQIADSIMRRLNPQGVLVVIEAEHMCMTLRGIRKPGSKTVTSAVRGSFQRSEVTRAEALSLING
ncbi:MAG: GTP cyclohydrolase I FolE [Thermoanaerobacteraceae bacterium]|uniref:GTP cyclohydrolase 1 n=1 Tax=Desulfofundulus thermobenzoicus TaxID=29376 RepID=A0A6N7ITG8_9FIRM|nr:GTP cyclohydrolase I FolE [Desulfofundulus thermobenzoicus]MBE3589031.1 GTP cyclohydrolase I FolE [Thermoanaerobacteraceae bacterium]MQL53374.1 GTP cyclohydrolase I FolE [Desulfofundulus thermobenzoicus]HHW43689.1 GTP cyclohydrolase I FolE [Desulfotomaculum sp.]